MERVLEPEVMDDDAEAAAYDAMDFAEADLAFVQRAAELCAGRPVRRIVDLGCGTGTIAVLLAERFPEAHVVGVDLAESMLRLAKARVSSHGFGSRITLLRRDAKATELASGEFDLVLSNSTLHHLPDPHRLLIEMKRLARPGAALLLVDLARPESAEAAWQIVEAAAGGADVRQRKLFFESLRAALEVGELAVMARDHGMAEATVERCSSRHLRLERPSSW